MKNNFQNDQAQVKMKIDDVNYQIQEGRREKPKVVHFERLARYRRIMDPVRDEQA